jgi:hypothetical protein
MAELPNQKAPPCKRQQALRSRKNRLFKSVHRHFDGADTDQKVDFFCRYCTAKHGNAYNNRTLSDSIDLNYPK